MSLMNIEVYKTTRMTENADGRGCWACQQIRVTTGILDHLAAVTFFLSAAVWATPLGGLFGDAMLRLASYRPSLLLYYVG